MKFFIKKLGCPKNDVDADFIAGTLISRGMQATEDDHQADIVIVNTCGFIVLAKEESINEILTYEKMKKEGRITRLYVTGCLSQRYAEELRAEIGGVDGFFGLGEIEALAAAIDSPLTPKASISRKKASDLSYLSMRSRYVEEKYPYEYLKIADGCDRFCAYCAIPFIRGRYRSRSLSDIVAEARFLASKGKKELILVSQEGTGYGKDLKDGDGIIGLLRELEKVDGVEWIRLMYLHPDSITDALIDYITSSDKVLGYFDIPLQHINDRILARMNRKTGRHDIEKLLSKIREISPANIIRTTFIAGLPGETDIEFAELRDFAIDFEFDRLGVFKYSLEEDTAAEGFDNQVAGKVAAERQDILMSLQQEIAFRKNIALIDSIQKVIIDEVKVDAPAMGRTGGDCPEIDQLVYVNDDNLKSGDLIDARIVMAEGYDLIATVVEK